MTPEFSRPERLDTIGERDRSVTFAATPEERRKLAARFAILSVDLLEARFTIRRDTSGIVAKGHVTAKVVQACSVTDEPLTATIDEPVALRFVDDFGAVDGEIELPDDALDTVPIDGGAVDLGEAAAETLALALDPFPRGPNAAAALRAAGVISEDEYQPVNAFSGLKAKLEGKG
ncbi:YceD family protein [Sphingomonas sp. Ant20]|uniref:YceD family protein n=1 Tax=Sphingomonas sp. Ant20 TaxID=104605 RepID=UPI000537D6B2|nr:YceD family protein [Sphingomonas sp. Ant20]KHA63535.1 chitinase [Sphingomonas sp. Ant20]